MKINANQLFLITNQKLYLSKKAIDLKSSHTQFATPSPKLLFSIQFKKKKKPQIMKFWCALTM